MHATTQRFPKATVAASLAVLLWSTLAALSMSLRDVPPLQLTGMALCIGGAISLPWARQWSFAPRSLAIGCYGILLYHLLFIFALRMAPALQANLVQYLWPTLIVVLSPLFVPGMRLRGVHLAAACAGFAGAALAIMSAGGAGMSSVPAGAAGGAGSGLTWSWQPGYGLAVAAAFVWSSYSLLQRRFAAAASPADTGLYCLVSGVAALLLHSGLEPTASLSGLQYLGLMALGIGPAGVAFYLWNYALRNGDPRQIGVLANATPLLSTLLLALVTRQALSALLGLAVALIVGASMLVLRGTAPERSP